MEMILLDSSNADVMLAERWNGVTWAIQSAPTYTVRWRQDAVAARRHRLHRPILERGE